MKKAEDLIPKNKFDFSGVEELRKLSDEEIAPIIPDLLAWMKDMNWPIAREIPHLLANHAEVVIPYIINVLGAEQNECDWKNYIIWDLLPLLDEKYLLELKPCLARIMLEPTEAEVVEETNVEAEDFFKERGWWVEGRLQ